MIILKKIVMGIVWFVVIYLGTCALVGGIAVAIAGAGDPEHAREAGEMAGEKAVATLIPFILGGSLLVSIAGSAMGFLPGTKSRRATPGVSDGTPGGQIENQNTIAEEVKNPRPAYWGFWGTIIWGALIAVVFVALQTATIVVLMLALGSKLPAAEFQQAFVAATTNGYVLSIATFVTTIMCTSLVAGIIKLKKNSVLKDYLCIRLVPLKTVLMWGGMLVVFIALADTLTILLGRPVVTEFMSTVYATADPLWMLWVALIIAAPVFEEIFFRGFLYQGLAAGFPGHTGAVLITAGLWSLIHTQYDAYDQALIFCLGLLLGFARARTGSLLVPIGLHAATNLEATIEAALWG